MDSAADPEKAFALKDVALSIEGQSILQGISLDFPKGRVTALVGHNGSGKSTLLKILARQIEPTAGTVHYAGRPIAELPARAFAREVAYMPQDPTNSADMTVGELVACGRYPWHGPLGRFTQQDRAKVDAALAATHLTELRERVVSTLSGGERQRACIAMLVAQDSNWLLLDEPTAAIDIAHQIDVLSLIRTLAREMGLGVIIVLHDINMAARFCDVIYALKHGGVIASGTPEELLRPEILRSIYGIEMGVVPHPTLSVPLAYAR